MLLFLINYFTWFSQKELHNYCRTTRCPYYSFDIPRLQLSFQISPQIINVCYTTYLDEASVGASLKI